MELIVGSLVSFSVLHYTTHPRSRVNKRIPSLKLFNFQVAPRINLAFKQRVIHLHHWLLLSPLFAFSQTGDHGLMSAGVIKGVLIGGIIQGLMYRDRFKFIFKHQDYLSIKDTQYHLKSLLKFWERK